MEELKDSVEKVIEKAGVSGRQLTGFFVLAAVILASILFLSKTSEPKAVKFEEYQTYGQGEEEGPAKEIAVHVCGAVNQEDVYYCLEGERVNDAIAKAGGASGQADLSAINLAAKLTDGQKIYVPSISERQVNASLTKSTQVQGGQININQATSSELEELTGIGPTLAKRIVAYRTQNGPFAVVEDLLKVEGIGEKKFESLKNEVSVY